MRTILRQIAMGKVVPSFEAKEEEYEIEIYLRGYDLRQIQQMATSHELQEQWSIFIPKGEKNAAEGSVRVRKTVLDGEVTNVLAIKSLRADGSKDEAEYPVDEDGFGMMKALAIEGMIKMRYIVPHTPEGSDPLTFEVDVFRDGKENTTTWVKIDLETRPGTRITASDIPFTHEEMLIVHPGDKQKDSGLAKRLKAMYLEHFVCKNALI